MDIPKKFRGHWNGLVYDAKRMKPYRSEIVLEINSIETLHHMVQGDVNGDVTEQWLTDHFLVYFETVGSWNGSLMLYLDLEHNLKCVWRSPKGNSESTMSRMASTNLKSD